MHRRGTAWRPPGPPIRPTAHVPPPRPPGHRPHGHSPRRRHGAWLVLRHVPVPLLVVAGLLGLSFLVTALATALGMAVVIGAIAAPVLIARGVARSVGRSRRQQLGAPQPYGAPLRGPAVGGPALMAPPPLPPVEVWRRARSRFAALRSEYAAYECDALAVLRLPALADVTVPSTARFVEAFAEAQALDVDAPPPPQLAHQYATAVERAWRCWQAAREAAERIRTSHLPEDERVTVERVVRLLTTARDTDNDAERLVAYGKARSELAKLERGGRFRVPRAAQAALDNAYRGQLPA